MAALAQSPLSPFRQPFGVVDSTRLQSLASKQNTQYDNNLATKPLSRKRSHASPDSDSENVAPVHFESAKRSRNQGDDDVSKQSPMKAPRFILNRIETPRSTQPNKKKVSTPASAPVRRLAGRSPTRKVSNAFSRRSSGGAAFKRIDPPRTKGRTCPAPFSLAEALSGPAVRQAQPKSWQFEIHEDTEQQEMSNLMEHSTCVLDISDDEGKSQSVNDGRGKENVPPQESAIVLPSPNQSDAVPAAIASSRKDMMTDEPRTPLGELNPTDFCPDGQDSTSCIVYDDETEEQCSSSKTQVDPPTANALDCNEPTTSPIATSPLQNELLTTATVSALIESTAPIVADSEQSSPIQDDATTTDIAASIPLPTDSEIDIWESGSATEEAAASEAVPVESIFSS